MNRQEILNEIEKVKKNKFFPEPLKEKKLAMLNAKLEKLEDKSDLSDEWKEELSEMLMGGESPEATQKWDSLTATQREEFIDYQHDAFSDFSNAGNWENGKAPTRAKVKKEVIYLIEQGRADKSAASSKKKSKKQNKTAKKAKSAKEKTTYQVDGKNIDDVPCDELIEKFKKRKEKAAKSEKKSKTKPVIEKIVSNVATATKQAIENVPVEDIKKDPAWYIEKFKAAEKNGEAFIASLKEILGDDYDKSEIKTGMSAVLDLIKEMEKKYK